jgi:hypothetical protein
MSYIAKNGRLYTSGASEALTLLDDKFSVNKSYSKGDSCIYNDYLWKFTSDKPAGEWNPSVVEQCRIMDFVDDVNGRLTQVQTQIVPTASIEIGDTASKAYNIGDFLAKDGILYKVTKAIAKGDALTAGTNIAITTIGGELSSIKSSSSDRVQLSLDAVPVGKDEDGNTIYEKTFKGTTISSGAVVDSNLTINNLKWIRLVGGCINNSGVQLMMLPWGGSSSDKYNFRVISNSQGLCVDYKDITVRMYHFTVQYVLA